MIVGVEKKTLIRIFPHKRMPTNIAVVGIGGTDKQDKVCIG
jgi:hypothetical protein